MHVTFLFFVPTNATMKSDNGNTGHAQGIGIILCCFPKCPIIYPVVKVYYCPGHPTNTTLLGECKCYVGSQKFTSGSLEHCGFMYLQGHFWRSPYETQNNLCYLQIENFKVNLQWNIYIVVPTIFCISKKNLS